MNYQSENKYYIIPNLNDYKVFTSWENAELHILDHAKHYDLDFVDVEGFMLDSIEVVRFDELSNEQKEYVCGDRG